LCTQFVAALMGLAADRPALFSGSTHPTSARVSLGDACEVAEQCDLGDRLAIGQRFNGHPSLERR
jgi:hypothetical protein